MAGFDDGAPAALHHLDPMLHAGGDDADQRPRDQHTEQGDQQGQESPTPADIARHRPRVERAQHALPDVFEPRSVLAPTQL